MTNEFTKSEIVEMLLNIVAPEAEYLGKYSKTRDNLKNKVLNYDTSELKQRFQTLTGMELISVSSGYQILRKYTNFLKDVKINGLRQYCD
jgi:hypothetical protein